MGRAGRLEKRVVGIRGFNRINSKSATGRAAQSETLTQGLNPARGNPCTKRCWLEPRLVSVGTERTIDVVVSRGKHGVRGPAIARSLLHAGHAPKKVRTIEPVHAVEIGEIGADRGEGAT